MTDTNVAPAAPAESAPANEPVQTPASGEASPQTPPQSSEPPREQITKHSRLQSRFDELTKQRYEEQRRAEAAEARLAEIERQHAQKETFSQLDSEEPQIERFNSLAEYQRAMHEWTVKKAAAVATAAWEKRMQEQYAQNQEQFARQEQQRIQQEQINAVIEQRMDAGRKKYPDFMEAIGNPELPPIRQHPALFGALLNCQNAHDIAYALAKNPAEYERFYAMRNPYQIARELFAIDQKFTGSAATTQAPAPPPQRNGTSTGSKTWQDMGTAEHVKAYQARRHKQRMGG